MDLKKFKTKCEELEAALKIEEDKKRRAWHQGDYMLIEVTDNRIWNLSLELRKLKDAYPHYELQLR